MWLLIFEGTIGSVHSPLGEGIKLSTEKFPQQYHIIIHIAGSSNNVFLKIFLGDIIGKIPIEFMLKGIFFGFKRQIVQNHVFGFLFSFVCKWNSFLPGSLPWSGLVIKKRRQLF